MSSDVVLSAALRSNLLSLQRTQSNVDKVQNALATGLKVSSALDNPQSFFAARSLNNRAADLSKLVDGIGQSISAVKQANTSVEQLTKLVEQADSIVSQAQDAAADSAIASVTGTKDLSAVDNITDLGINGTTVGNYLIIKVNNPDDATVTYTLNVSLSAGDSIDQVLAKINSSGTPNGTPAVTSSYDSAGEAFVEASLTADGNLKIAAANGGNLQITFQQDSTDAGTSIENAPALALASALGFGSIAGQVDSAAGATDTNDDAIQVTAVANNKLVSGVFYDGSVDNTFADASDLLTTVDDTATGSNKRFVFSSTNNDTITVSINNGTTVSLTVDSDSTTIQGLVDKINGNATLKAFVKAEYDATTGQFSIAKISSKLETLEIGVTNGDGSAQGGTEADFDFGLSALTTTTELNASSELFVFGASSGVLAQLEKDFNKVREQIDDLVNDSAYSGANLLKGEDLVTYFNSDRTSSLTTSGVDLTTAGLNIEEADFASETTIASFTSSVRAALSTVRTFSGSLANDLNLIQTREEFTKETINNLSEGSDKLTVADQNEEGAKLLALQTRQQLGVTALSLAAQAQQSVLRLF